MELAKQELTLRLRRECDGEVAQARINERISVAHDLHDGLGGMLVSNIAVLERAPHAMSAERFLALLKALRDDLRLIIESAAQAHPDAQAIDEWIAPLRHRLTQLLENQGIDCHWQIRCVASVRMPASLGVDVMRILQEGVANVLKHSQATRVDIELRSDGETLDITVADNGIGFDTQRAPSTQHIGLRSIRTRVARHGGTMSIQSSSGATVFNAHVPLAR
jgi:signal transduction histidine kinase